MRQFEWRLVRGYRRPGARRGVLCRFRVLPWRFPEENWRASVDEDGMDVHKVCFTYALLGTAPEDKYIESILEMNKPSRRLLMRMLTYCPADQASSTTVLNKEGVDILSRFMNAPTYERGQVSATYRSSGDDYQVLAWPETL